MTLTQFRDKSDKLPDSAQNNSESMARYETYSHQFIIKKEIVSI